LAGWSQDGRYIYAAGADNTLPSSIFGIFQIDLDNFTNAGATFFGGFPSSANTTYSFFDVEALPGKVVFH